MMKATATAIAIAATISNTAADCSSEYGQCGGIAWTGPKCCSAGFTCVPQAGNPWYSQCKPEGEKECSAIWGQCGGEGFAGPKCCYGDNVTCVPQPGNKWYSQCLPKTNVTGCAKLYGQCGGEGWGGAQCCEAGSKCVPQSNNRWYSQCLPLGPTPAPTTAAPTEVGATAAPTTADSCSGLWDQCGGMYWSGPKCCSGNTECVPQANNPYYSQCLPGHGPTPAPTTAAPTVVGETPAPTAPVCTYIWRQCGGTSWTGATCCSSGSVCVPQLNNPWYSQCLPAAAAKQEDYTITFAVLGEDVTSLTAADKLAIRAGVAKVAGVDITAVFFASAVNGAPSPVARASSPAVIGAVTVVVDINGSYINMDAVAPGTLSNATGFDIAAACELPLLPNSSGACVCDTGLAPNASGECIVYGA